MAREPKPSGRRSSASSSLRRQGGSRAPKRTFKIFCEGKVTEPAYLEALRREPSIDRASALEIADVDQVAGSAPLSLVQLAVKDKDSSTRFHGEIDEFWCVFDIESPTTHPNLDEAFALAKAEGIHTAVSNPCFELWLILHFADQTAYVTTEETIKLRRTHDQSTGKELDRLLYMPKRPEAERRATALRRRHQGNGTQFPNDNPSSEMDRLLRALLPK